MMNREDEDRQADHRGEASYTQDDDEVTSVSSDGSDTQELRRGASKLIIRHSDQAVSPESATPRPIAPEPRAVSAPKEDLSFVPNSDDIDVTRLEQSVNPGKERVKPDSVQFEKLAERPREDEIQEEQWGQSFGGMGLKMMMMGGGITIALVVGLVVMRGVFDGQTVMAEEPRLVAPVEIEKNPYEGSPEKWFRDRSGKIGDLGLEVIQGFVSASGAEARSHWVSNPNEYLEKSPHWPVPIDPILKPSMQSWDIGHTGEVAYLIMNARNQRYEPFRAYFTRVGEELKLDWAASAAWSEVSLQAIRAEGVKRGGPITEMQLNAGVVDPSLISPSLKSELPEALHTDSVLLRCMIRRRDEFYAGPYNDREHSAYMLLSADRMHHMWGYALKGSVLDQKLKSVLDHGSFIVNLKTDQRVTLRVKVNKKEALASQLELVELVNPEWVNSDE